MTKKPNDPNVYGQTDLSYNRYLMVDELLKLQVPQSKPGHHDELLFIIIHQSYELWFKLIISELEIAFTQLKKRSAYEATHNISRVSEILRNLVPQIHILETMRPVDFLRFRDRLKPASGFQSVQFREVEFLAGLKDERYLGYFSKDPANFERLKARHDGETLRDAFFGFMRAEGFSVPEKIDESNFEETVKALTEIYQKPSEYLVEYQLCEALLNLDEYLGLWRDHHARVVERIIGYKQGTGGSSGVDYLRMSLSKKCFPELWHIRTQLI